METFHILGGDRLDWDHLWHYFHASLNLHFDCRHWNRLWINFNTDLSMSRYRWNWDALWVDSQA
jgi:hypothetical protein